MGWDAAIHGRLVIPSDQREAWLAAELDWASVPGHAAWDGPVHGKHVRDVVDGRGFVGEEGIEFLELAWSGDELCVRSFMAEDGFIDHVIGLAAAWAAAAPFGGRGELIGMGMLTAAFGYRLRVGEGRASFEAVPDDEVDDLDDHPDAEAIEARVVTASESLLAEYGDDDEDDDEDDEAPAKPAAKKPAAKKPAAKKPAAKKPASKKPAAKKPAAKKPAAKKPASKKPASKKPR